MRVPRFCQFVIPVLTVVLLSLGAAVQVSAQTTAGLKVGVNVADVRLEAFTEDPSGRSEVVETDRKAGAVGGLFVGHEMRNRLGVQVEGLISQKGASFAPFGLDIDLRLTYLEVPVLASYGLGSADGPRVRLMVGPTFGILLSDRQEVEGERLQGDDNVEFKTGDVGLTIGGTIDVQRFLFDIRYTHGLANWLDEDDEGVVSLKNRVLTFSVGWRFL